jgi:ribosomal protein L3 glutamine methyltransferase
MNLLELINVHAKQLDTAGVAFGHGTTNAFDEAAWLALWGLGLPLDTPLDEPLPPGTTPEALAMLTLASDSPVPLSFRSISTTDKEKLAILFDSRIRTRQPVAYLTHEAWLQGVAFYVDERCIVPRSFIAELLCQADGAANIDPWLGTDTRRVLDLCTGNGSLAVLAAMAFPDVVVDAADLSVAALEVAKINVNRHQLQSQITLLESDGLTQVRGPYDLILCNPPYVNASSMATLPAEYQAEPELALAGGPDGMDFIRTLLQAAPAHMSDHAVLILEIGNERENFEAAFPTLEVFWLETSAGEDQVLLVTREALMS